MEQDYSHLSPLKEPSEVFSLKGKKGLILGGLGKMGQEFGQFLSKAGARVYLADLLSVEEGEKTVEALPGEIKYLSVDAAQEESLQEFWASYREKEESLDFYIHNVMAKPEGYYRSFENYQQETFEKVVTANMTSAFFSAREASNLMSEGSAMVLTSSIYGIVSPDQRVYEGMNPGSNIYGGGDPLSLPASYSASKGGIIALGKYLATFLAPKGIRVNTFTPGGVFDGQEESFHKAYIERTPLKRMATWSDYNGGVLFLISQASRYMTGANLVIDGGWTAW